MKKSRNRVDFVEDDHKIWYNKHVFCLLTGIVEDIDSNAVYDSTENYDR